MLPAPLFQCVFEGVAEALQSTGNKATIARALRTVVQMAESFTQNDDQATQSPAAAQRREQLCASVDRLVAPRALEILTTLLVTNHEAQQNQKPLLTTMLALFSLPVFRVRLLT